MKAGECPYEAAVVDLVLTGPRDVAAVHDRLDHADASLRGHVGACDVCSDVLAIAVLLGRERDSLRDAPVPAAGQVWWRAALRAHVEAGHAARRPLVWLQGVAAACAVGVIVALANLWWPALHDAVGAAVAVLPLDVPPLPDSLWPALGVVLAGLVCLVLTPLLVYWALSDD